MQVNAKKNVVIFHLTYSSFSNLVSKYVLTEPNTSIRGFLAGRMRLSELVLPPWQTKNLRKVYHIHLHSLPQIKAHISNPLWILSGFLCLVECTPSDFYKIRKPLYLTKSKIASPSSECTTACCWQSGILHSPPIADK